MILSRACEYGIQVMLYLHQHGGDNHVTVSEIARQQGISPSFLSKITGQLVTHSLLDSRRGPDGGVRLARPSDKIHLIDVIEAIDGPQLRTRCVIGLPGCGTDNPCPIHSTWGPLREKLISGLSDRTLASLMSHGNYLISRTGHIARNRHVTSESVY